MGERDHAQYQSDRDCDCRPGHELGDRRSRRPRRGLGSQPEGGGHAAPPIRLDLQGLLGTQVGHSTSGYSGFRLSSSTRGVVSKATTHAYKLVPCD
jgi:hypothetical protein